MVKCYDLRDQLMVKCAFYSLLIIPCITIYSSRVRTCFLRCSSLITPLRQVSLSLIGVGTCMGFFFDVMENHVLRNWVIAI